MMKCFLWLWLLSSVAFADLSVIDFGAKGDGQTDDTAAINQAVNAAALSASSVLIPDGTYLIDPAQGVKLTSGSHLLLKPKATLKAIPSSLGHYRIVQVYNCDGVTITGGRLIGDRAEHVGESGEWGMGIDVRNSKNVKISGVWVGECWGDGVYISAGQDIAIVGITCEHNRRQGLSIVDGSGITVRGSSFTQTDGVLPSSGIQIEPNDGQTVESVQIINCRCENNNGRGIGCTVPTRLKGKARVRSVSIERCNIRGNGCEVPAFGMEISNCEDVNLSGCEVEDNLGIGIGVMASDRVRITGARIRGTVRTVNKSDAGVLFSESNGELSGCRITDNDPPGMYFLRSYVAVKRANVVRGNGL